MLRRRIKQDERGSPGTGVTLYEEVRKASQRLMDEQDLIGTRRQAAWVFMEGAVSAKTLSVGGPERVEEEQGDQ